MTVPATVDITLREFEVRVEAEGRRTTVIKASLVTPEEGWILNSDDAGDRVTHWTHKRTYATLDAAQEAAVKFAGALADLRVEEAAVLARIQELYDLWAQSPSRIPGETLG
jgi:hypothetical protein